MLRRPSKLLGIPEYSAAVSQIGSVAGAFLLGAREGRWDFTMKNADSNEPGSSISAIGPDAKPDTARWRHLAGVYEADADTIRLYVDGERVAETAFDAPWQATGPLTVGRAQVHGRRGNFWCGAVADLAVYDRALGDEQVAQAAARSRPRSAPPLPPAVPREVSVLDGVYVYDMTPTESKMLEQLFGDEAKPAGFPGDASVVQRFSGGLWQQYYLIDGNPYLVKGNPEGDGGTATVNGDVLTLDNQAGAVDYRWKLEDGVLSLKLLTPVNDPVVRFVMEHDYRKVTE
jgi:hypothetical protein